jgi:hypothetical protein
LGCVDVLVARLLRVLAAVFVVRDPAVAGLRLVVVRFVVDAGVLPGVVIDIGSLPICLNYRTCVCKP